MSQIKSVRVVQDEAWGYGYKDGLNRLRDYIRDHATIDLSTLNLASLEPNPRAFKFIKTLGKVVMLLTFLDAPPSP